MKLPLAIRELHRAEHELALEFAAVSARHDADAEIHYLAGDLARSSREHLILLAEAGNRYGLHVDPRPHNRPWTARVQRKLGEAVARRPEPGLLLLADLRRLHRIAAGVSLDWELLAQGAQAARTPDLLGLAERCHPDTLRQLRWTNAMLKIVSPQILAS